VSGENNHMEINQEVIKALLDAFDRSDWQEMTVTIGGDRLHVSRREGGRPAAAAPPPAARTPPAPAPAAPQAEEPAPAPAAAPSPTPSEPPPDGTVVASPSVGLFWRAPSPGAPPFVEVGSSVTEGDTLAIVEVMKLMNHVTAPAAGVVKAILPENGESVVLGQPLVVIDAED
jgi:acetyl-CoA carboxylase biotin carboxyl carrier protein